MFLPKFCIKRPVAATVMVLVLVIFGLISLGKLGIRLYPDVDYPVVTVTTIWSNARPEEVDINITDRLEDPLSGISEVKHITSDSYLGFSQITVEFELSKDIDVAAQEIRDKVSTVISKLPADAESPIIKKMDINARPVMWMALSGPRPVEYLTDYADKILKPKFQALKGVGDVNISAGRKKEVRIWLWRDRLAAYGLGVNEVIDSLRRQHIDVPGGKVESTGREYLVRTLGEFYSEEAFNDLIIASRHGTTVRLRNIGYAKAGREEFKGTARYHAPSGVHQAVVISVAPRSGANELELASLVRANLAKILPTLPAGLNMEVASDNSVFTKESIDEVKFHLIVGGIMAALVVFLFLQNVRTTMFTAIAIPTSIIATFSAIRAAGFTLNNMTMLALTTAVGLVIDDSIVMEENIYRHRFELGKDPMIAARDGASEIGFAVVAATLSLVSVFLPVAFMGGIIGRFFREFALTMAVAVGASGFVALTVEPMLASRFLKPGGEGIRAFKIFERLMTAAVKFYRRQLAWCLKHRGIVLGVAIGTLVLGGLFFAGLEREFITGEDQSKFIVRITTPLSYSSQKTDEAMRGVEEWLHTQPEVRHFFSISGYRGGGASQSNKGLMIVTLTPKDERGVSQREFMMRMRKKISQIPDMRGAVSDISLLGGGSRGEEIQFVILGPSLEGLDRYSGEIIKRMAASEGFVDMDRSLELGKPEVRVRIDRDKAADLGVDVKTIATGVEALIGGKAVAEFRSGSESYDVRLRLVEEERSLPTDISRLWVRTDRREVLDLSSFVTIEMGVGPSVVNRTDLQRSVTVYSNLEGIKLGEAMEKLNTIAAEVLPEGYTSKYIGKSEAFRETGQYIAFAFLLATILTYLILAAQFESFVYPFSIMVGLPLSFVGAFGFLLITGNTFNLFSMMALILLVGLITKNGILLVDRTNQLRAAGYKVDDALVEAGGTRFRPILMTAFSTIAGVVPVALGLGVGAESRQPMALAIAGGMLSSTVLTLVVVPVIYSYLDRFSRFRIFGRLKKLFWAEHESAFN